MVGVSILANDESFIFNAHFFLSLVCEVQLFFLLFLIDLGLLSAGPTVGDGEISSILPHLVPPRGGG